MLPFLIKKTYYALLDNILKIALLNLGFVFSLVLLTGLVFSSVFPPAIAMATAAAGWIWVNIYISATAAVMGKISDYEKFSFRDFYDSLITGIPAAAAMAVLSLAWTVVFYLAIYYYLAMKNMAGFLGAVLMFWVFMAGLVAVQLYYPVRNRLGIRNLFLIIKKCLFLFMESPGIHVASALHCLAALTASAFLAFTVPGICGAMLFRDGALKLLRLKYAYLLGNPGADRRKIPWDIILEEEIKLTGEKTLKNFFSVWKN